MHSIFAAEVGYQSYPEGKPILMDRETTRHDHLKDPQEHHGLRVQGLSVNFRVKV